MARNLYAIGKVVALVGLYSKTSSVSGKDRWIPRALDGLDHDMMVNMVAIAMPFAVKAAAISMPDKPELIELYSTHLFVDVTKKFTTDKLSACLKALSLETMGVALGVRDGRQVSTAVRRAHCPSVEGLLGMEENDVGAQLAGHTRATENRHYGVSTSYLANIPEDMQQPYFKYSAKYHEFLGLPPSGNPVPWQRMFNRDQWYAPRNLSAPAPAPAPAPASSSSTSSQTLVASPAPLNDDAGEWSHEDSYVDSVDGLTNTNDDNDAAPVKDTGALATYIENITADMDVDNSSEAQFGSPYEEEVEDVDGVFPGQEDLPSVSMVLLDVPMSQQTMSHRDQLALAHLRRYLGDPSADWICPEQRRAVLAAMEHNEDVVVAFPTGLGKSIIAILCFSIRRKIIPIIVPFVALVYDWQRRLEDGGFRVAVFKSGMSTFPVDCDFIITTMDAAVTGGFRTAVTVAVGEGLMDQMVIDEVQEVFVAQNYRAVMLQMWSVRTAPFQLIAMSATLPEALEERLISELHFMPDTRVIRAPSNRPELQYMLERREPHPQRLQERLAVIVRRELADFSAEDRALIYVRSNTSGRVLSSWLKCDFYSASNGDDVDKRREMVNRWREGVHKIMVCTSAFSAGNDYPAHAPGDG
ncbi:hypothetical protein NP233_g12344 [Leucocoprinus birnbaumii]|uniref:DNA 3'-5' helicase n=1 Tax=Leucocoprinus birnbaumii TaxID=56174 RepID=A0AAD5YJI9_9AGAR|nr:hypothetical protein NP233_g12344 [Leucocoprinus birnbaumii]